MNRRAHLDYPEARRSRGLTLDLTSCRLHIPGNSGGRPNRRSLTCCSGKGCELCPEPARTRAGGPWPNRNRQPWRPARSTLPSRLTAMIRCPPNGLESSFEGVGGSIVGRHRVLAKGRGSVRAFENEPARCGLSDSVSCGCQAGSSSVGAPRLVLVPLGRFGAEARLAGSPPSHGKDGRATGL